MIARWPYVDCEGLAGAWTLGTIQTRGFDLVHRVSLKGGFGDAVVEDNRALLGTEWEQDPGGESGEWLPVECAYMNGTPPCSGFSLLNVSAAAARKAGRDVPQNARGIDAAINDCMKELARYAGKCRGTDGKLGPEVVSFESVQGAGKLGRPLMQALRDIIETLTGQEYGLSHVFMSGSSVGAAQMRHRYYVVFHRIPFGVDVPEPRRVATYRDAIADLMGLKLQWEAQRYPHVLTLAQDKYWWLLEQGIRTGNPDITAHVTYNDENDGDNGRSIYRRELLPLWKDGDMTRDEVMREYIKRHGKTPKGAEKWWDWEMNGFKGFSGPRRLRPDRPGYVLTGGGVSDFFHWEEDRFLTVRETARLMGYPDAWSFASAKGINQASAWIGKCCPVQSGRWISNWVLRALNGEPGGPLEEIGHNEFMHNSTLAYKRWPREISHLSEGVK
jgi:site-specific DNA-cytosine methylase